MMFPHLQFHNVQAVKLAGQLGVHRRSPASSAAQPHLFQQHHPRLSSGLVVPVFAMSSVTGLGLPVLHAFLNALPASPHTATPFMENPSGHNPVAEHAVPAEHVVHAEHAGVQMIPQSGTAKAFQHHGNAWDANGNPQMDSRVGDGMMQNGTLNLSKPLAQPQVAATHFQVDHTFEVKGVGCVVSGTVVSGQVAVGQVLNLGPTGLGLFSEVQVTCIHRSQVQPYADLSGRCVVCTHSSQLDSQHGLVPEGLASNLTAAELHSHGLLLSIRCCGGGSDGGQVSL